MANSIAELYKSKKTVFRVTDLAIFWKIYNPDVLKAKIQGHVRGYETRSQVRQREQIVALQCRKECKSLAEQLAMWKEKTGKSRQAFYDRLKESA